MKKICIFFYFPYENLYLKASNLSSYSHAGHVTKSKLVIIVKTQKIKNLTAQKTGYPKMQTNYNQFAYQLALTKDITA